MATALVLSPDEIYAVTRRKLPGMQLQALHERGFHRAFRAADGAIVLERAHYDAVCRAELQRQDNERAGPRFDHFRRAPRPA